MGMKEDRLHIQPAHLQEVKPAQMPFQAHWQTWRLLTGATVRDSGVSLYAFLLPVVPFQIPMFRHLQLHVSYQRPSSLWPWRVSARRAFVSYHPPARVISPLLCTGFFFSPLSVVGIPLFFLSCSQQVHHRDSLLRGQCCFLPIQTDLGGLKLVMSSCMLSGCQITSVHKYALYLVSAL